MTAQRAISPPCARRCRIPAPVIGVTYAGYAGSEAFDVKKRRCPRRQARALSHAAAAAIASGASTHDDGRRCGGEAGRE